MNESVKQTLLARVYDVATKTPCQHAPMPSARLGCDVYLKREDLQPVHSFKLRGAYNKMMHLSTAERKQGVIAASAGNHAQGVALAAQKLGITALIVMPQTTPSIKIDAVASYGAEIELAGDSYTEAYEYCQERIKQTGRTFIHPFDDPLVIAGQGTIGREVLEQCTSVTHIFVPVGGGGLIAGIAQYVKALRPEVKIIGVQSEDADNLQPSLKHGHPVYLPHVGIFSDGTAVKQLGKHTFAIIKDLVDDHVTVSTDELCAAMKAVFETTRSLVEPAGALGLAGLTKYAASHQMKNAHAVAICSGANISFERLQFVAERTLIGSGKEALFAVTIPERPGSLKDFCELAIGSHSINRFSYRLNKRDQAHVFVGINVSGNEERKALQQQITAVDYDCIDLSTDDLTKEHIKHMIGGASPTSHNEHLYEITLPERPGALRDFLYQLGTQWNISLFHYRNMGGNESRVLLGFEAKETKKLEKMLATTSTTFRPIHSAAASIFLGIS